MSRASESRTMGRHLAAYSLMRVSEVAAFLRCSDTVAKGMIDDGTIPSVPVGKRRLVDPIDAIVHLLAGREGLTAKEFWQVHGDAVAELAREHYQRILKLQAGAAA